MKNCTLWADLTPILLFELHNGRNCILDVKSPPKERQLYLEEQCSTLHFHFSKSFLRPYSSSLTV